MVRAVLTEADVPRMREVARLGAVEAARQMGISEWSFRRYAKRWGVWYAPAHPKATRHAPMAERYRQCAAAGMTRQQTADHLGVSYEAVCLASKRHGIAFVSAQKLYAARHPHVRAAALRKAWEAHA